MGNCCSLGHGSQTRQDSSSHVDGAGVVVGKNQPLRPELPGWTSEVPITRGQLLSKRDEFWDTAPMFDGRKEIWDALKAAAYALENRDVKLAQAVVDGANISLPTGTLSDCYDELGNKYQLPAYVLNVPTNLIVETDEYVNDAGGDGDHELAGEDVSLKLRLSTGKDVKIIVRTTETVARAKQKLSAAEFDGGLESSQQRWFFGGRILGDKLRVEDARIPRGHVVQVVVAATAAAATPVASPREPAILSAATTTSPDQPSESVTTSTTEPLRPVADASIDTPTILPLTTSQCSDGSNLPAPDCFSVTTPREPQVEMPGVDGARRSSIVGLPTPVG